MLRRSLLLASITLFASTSALAQGAAARSQYRQPSEGFVYVGSAPGVNFGGQAMPRALYMDFVHGGYVFPSGLDISLALSGMNWFPTEGEYSFSMGRAIIGYRPFLRDPLPMIQPYGFTGFGFGGEGRYQCEPEPKCDPRTDSCRDICGRARWTYDAFIGAGVDFNAFLFYVGQQQVLFYAGVQARYEFLGKYQMPVFTLPIGLRIQ